jgi:hypothetical protein
MPDDDPFDSSITGADARRSRRRRERERRSARRKRRALASLAVGVLLVAAVAMATGSGGGASRSHGAPKTDGAAGTEGRPAVVPGGPLAPRAVGGLAALWAPENVVGVQPGTAAAYEAASKRAGLPGYLLIADRGNDRILVVNPQHEVVFRYPTPEDLAQGRKLIFDDDTFVEPGGNALISNEEDNHAIVQVTLADHAMSVLFGHPGEAGSDATHLRTPDDAYMLPDGTLTVADAYNCRILFIAGHAIVRAYGHAGICRHDPPRYLGAVNGDTPMPGGGVLVSEIEGSWIDAIDGQGRLAFAVRAPVQYPSDPQPLPGGRILLADYATPGHVLIISRHGRVLWRYGPATGGGELNHPSLAMALPNGDVAVNDDYRNRVVVINPRTNRIVWQYGHTGAPGTAHGYLNTPDGMDFVPAGPNGLPDYAAVVHP